jgi:hypothetical protein
VGILSQKVQSQAKDIQDYLERNGSLGSKSAKKGGDDDSDLLRRQIADLQHKNRVLEKSARAGSDDNLQADLDQMERENDRLTREIANI